MCSVLRIRNVYPGSRILSFTHPGSRIQKQQQKRGVKLCCNSHKFHKIVNYFIFEMLKKKIRASFQRIIELFTQKFVMGLGSGIRDPERTYSGSRSRVQGTKKAPDPGSGSATLNVFMSPMRT